MPEIVMYTTTYCPYCSSAKSLLDSKGLSWEEINLDQEPHRRAEMIEKAGGRHTVPHSPSDKPQQLATAPQGHNTACVWDLHLQYFERQAWVEEVLAKPHELLQEF